MVKDIQKLNKHTTIYLKYGLLRSYHAGTLLLFKLSKNQLNKIKRLNDDTNRKPYFIQVSKKNLLTNADIKRYKKQLPQRLLSSNSTHAVKTYYKNSVITTNKNKSYYNEIDLLNSYRITNITKKDEEIINNILIDKSIKEINQTLQTYLF